MKIKELELTARKPEALIDFYKEKLGLKLGNGLLIGESMLRFNKGEKSRPYHFAFNISYQDLENACEWLKSRGIETLPYDGEEIVAFESWEAKAVYFHDLEGNIVELIGRKRLEFPKSEAFSADSIMSISEMGFASSNFAHHYKMLTETTQIKQFSGGESVFAALGDDHGLFILVDSNIKKWIPMMEIAVPMEFQIKSEINGIDWWINFDGEKLRFNRAE